MENIPEGRKQKLRTALEKLATIQPSYVPKLVHGWLEALNDGVPHDTKMSLDTAGLDIIKPSKDKGPVHTPPYHDAYPARLDNDQVIWLQPSRSRSHRGYKPIVVLGNQHRETKATVAALTVLEGSISNPEELREALLLLLSAQTSKPRILAA